MLRLVVLTLALSSAAGLTLPPVFSRRGAIAAADAALVCKLFLEFLSGLVEGNLRSCAEKECVATALYLLIFRSY